MSMFNKNPRNVQDVSRRLNQVMGPKITEDHHSAHLLLANTPPDGGYVLDIDRHDYDADLNKGPHTPDELHVALRPVLVLAQCFALMPLYGVSSPHPKHLRFQWFSIRVLYTCALVVGSITIVILSIIRTVNNGISFLSTVDFVFFGSSAIVALLFLKLATEWKQLVDEWGPAERKIIRIYGPLKKLPNQMRTMAYTVMALAFAEHVTATATHVANALPCTGGEWNWRLAEAYYHFAFRQVFSQTEVSLWIAAPLSVLNLLVTCAWNFMDLFIMVLSVALAARFKQINDKLESVKGKVMPRWFWRQTRELYNTLSCLTKRLDETLSLIVLLSFANNLYFICLQLLNSLKPLRNLWQAIYFVFSFGYLVLRTATVSLFAAHIFDESKRPVSVLFSVPSECYCTEVQRFLTQVTSDNLALTGCRFFSVTRTLMLTVAGTIVTYEIVLVQFNAVNSADDNSHNLTANCFM
uniref:Gustatory receptor n=1 Tax=Nilaparvata lugens TaxID=108931 RepID=A0A2H4WQ18_NILLU|nr:gustatory receptor 11 [Nilaparvata lugens]